MQYMDLWSEILCLWQIFKINHFFLYKWIWSYTVTLNCADSEIALQITCNDII